MSSTSIITVSQLNFYVKSLMDGDKVLSNVFLSGEISNLTDHYKSGHIYLSLKDEKAVVKCVMFAGYASRLKFVLQNGMKIIASGKVSIYEATGQYQFYIEQIQPDGIGAFTAAFEQLKRKLGDEGLFDTGKKKPLPPMPQKIGVITSPTGAVRKDIEQVLKRRYPLAELLLYPATVQGENAAKELIKAVSYFQTNQNADVLIIGRGGGSIEDLWAFNDEALARTIAACSIPIVSAVGHETDFTICDFVADLRAPTPSAAAELVAPDIHDLMDKLDSMQYTLRFLTGKKLKQEQNWLEHIQAKRVLSSPFVLFERFAVTLDQQTEKLQTLFLEQIINKEQTLAKLSAKLHVLSPLNSLARGYAIPLKEGATVKSVKQLAKEDQIQLIFHDGEVTCTVDKIKE